MATGKTINELPDIGQLTGGEMIPVSSHKQNKYTTGKTTVKNISDGVLVTVDEKIKDFVSKSELDTTLSSYASTASVDEKLSNYVSNEKLTNYSTTSEVDEKISVANDTVTAAIDKKISDAGYITRQDAIDIASYYSTFAITNAYFTYGENKIQLAGYHSAYFDDDYDYIMCVLRNYDDYTVTDYTVTDSEDGSVGWNDDGSWSIWFNHWYDNWDDIPNMRLILTADDVLTGKHTDRYIFVPDNVKNEDGTHSILWESDNTINGKDIHGMMSYNTVVNTDGLPFVTRNYPGSGYNDNTHVCCGVSRGMAAFTADAGGNYTSKAGSDLSQYVNDTALSFMESYTCGIMIPKGTKEITINNTGPDSSYCDVIVDVYYGTDYEMTSTTYAGQSSTMKIDTAYRSTDIVAQGYAPAGQSFTKSTNIDWDTMYISASLDVTNVIGNNANILSVGNSIATWEGTHFHFYYTRSTKTLQIRYLNSSGVVFQQDVTLSNADVINFEISKQNGLVINGTKYNNGKTPAEIYSDLFALTNIYVGSSEGSVHSTATYKYLSLVKFFVPSLGVHGDTFLTITAQNYLGTTMTELPDLSYINISFRQ